MEHAFRKLQVDPTEHSVLMPLPNNCPEHLQEQIAEILFEKIGVPSLCYSSQASLVAYSVMQTKGLIVVTPNRIPQTNFIRIAVIIELKFVQFTMQNQYEKPVSLWNMQATPFPQNWSNYCVKTIQCPGNTLNKPISLTKSKQK